MILSSVCLSVTQYIVELGIGVLGWKMFRCFPRRALPIHFFGHFCHRMYHLATKHGNRLKSESILQFETVNKKILTLTTAIPDNGLSLYHNMLYAVQLAMVAPAELLFEASFYACCNINRFSSVAFRCLAERTWLKMACDISAGMPRQLFNYYYYLGFCIVCFYRLFVML